MRLFPITNFILTSVRKAGRGACWAIVAAGLLCVPLGESLSAAGPQPTGGSDEEDPTYPEVPDIDSIWNSASPAPTYYGGLHASGIGFQYWNNYMLMETVWERLRNVALVTYNGEDGTTGSGLVPNNGGYGTVPANQIGDYRYSTGGYPTAPYGPGYAPGYEEGYPGYQSGYPVYQDGIMMPQQNNAVGMAPPLYRGQAAYGDPGTLIYSLWAGVVGGSGNVKDHGSSPGYKTEDVGGVIGIDLFGSTDCRSGVFYAYQNAELKGRDLAYDYLDVQTGTLLDPTEIVGEGEEEQYSTSYDYTADYSGAFKGHLKGHNHLIGLYHQFGSEFIYNILTARVGYNRMKSHSAISEIGAATGTVTKTRSEFVDGVLVNESSNVEPYADEDIDAYSLNAKYNEYLGGVSIERGANLKFLNVLTFTPRANLDYTYMFRDKIRESVEGLGTINYKKKSYHSLRSQLGGDLAIDLYPGDGHFRALVRGGWIHEFLNYHYGKTALTTPYDVGWEVRGNPAGRDWAVIGAGAEWAIVPGFMIFADYDFYKNKYLKSHYGDVGMKLMW
ncbi:MAG: autotransporter domain-containing protein [Thermoguttaceae bacterium]|nr:autotransporter domain-containing protein [Thermoguttaceae bacterium]